MTEYKLEWQRIYDLLNAETKPKNSKIIGVSSWLPSIPDLNPLNYALWGILENKTNAPSHVNIDSLKTAIEEDFNQMSEEFILKASKSFQRHVDTIVEKNYSHIEQIYSFFGKLLILLFIFFNEINFVL